MGVVTKVEITRVAEKQLNKVPRSIQEAVFVWVSSVEEIGIAKIRLILGYHDKPLWGSRIGQRSVRLNRSYRLFYTVCSKAHIATLIVLEVNKHDYK